MKQREKIFGLLVMPFVPKAIIKLTNKHQHLILYGIIGGGALIIDVSLFWLIDTITNISIILNNGLSIFVAMIYSFLMNAFFNFRTRKHLPRRFASFLAVTVTGFVISSTILSTLTFMGMNNLIAKSFTLPVVFMVQF